MSLRPHDREQGRRSRCLVIVSRRMWPAGLIWVNSAKRRRAERGSGNESVVIKRGLSEHLTSLKWRACSVGTSWGFALLVIELAASPPEQSIRNVALQSGGGQVSLSSLIFYRKSGKKTSLGLFLKGKWLSGIIFLFSSPSTTLGFRITTPKVRGLGGGLTLEYQKIFECLLIWLTSSHILKFMDASCLFICIISENKHLLKEMGHAD